jgi:hypothetical protein
MARMRSWDAVGASVVDELHLLALLLVLFRFKTNDSVESDPGGTAKCRRVMIGIIMVVVARMCELVA